MTIVTTRLGSVDSAKRTRFAPVATIASTSVQEAIKEVASEAQPLDADLTAIAALSGIGIARRTASNTWALSATPTVVSTSSATIAAGTELVVIQRASPATTGLTLPSVANQGGLELVIADLSTSVTEHTITLTPAGAETVMLSATWPIVSNSVQLASVTLIPSTTLQCWIIAP